MPSPEHCPNPDPPSDFNQIAKSLWLGWNPKVVGVLAIVVFALPMLVAIWNLYQRANSILEGEIREDLLAAARSVAQGIDVEMHSTFVRPEQESSDTYVRQIEKMDRVKAALDVRGLIKFVYTCTVKGDKIHFVLDTTPAGDVDHDGVDDKAHVMDVYQTPSEVLWTVLNTGVAAADSEPYTDQWGTFMSGYAPLFDSRHQVVGAVGVDLALTDFELRQSGLGHVAILSALGAVCLSVVAGLGVAAYHQRLQRSVNHLLVAGEAAMAAVRTKADFLASMSHELRTPMNAVLGMTELLRDTKLDDRQTSFLGTIQSSGESLLNTITDILDFSQLDVGQMKAEQVPVDVRAIIDALHSQSKSELSAKGLSFEPEINPALPRHILGDPTHVKQVLRHLIMNAIKFTSSGGIKVRATSETEGGVSILHLCVMDTGIGMDAAQQAELFRPFFQADSATTRRHGGTGIGLAICKRLCDVMKGRIWVASQPGKGSEFHVIIPAEVLREEHATALPKSAVVWSQDSVTGMLVGRVIEKLGQRVSSVRTREELMSALRDEDFDAVLLDAAVLGDGDVNAVRAAADGLRVIVINAEPGKFAVGAVDAVLTPPLRPADLRSALE
jgi:signal transduction histidine kinase